MLLYLYHQHITQGGGKLSAYSLFHFRIDYVILLEVVSSKK